MKRHFAFQQVDVFTAVPLRGNPLAVVLGGEDLSLEEMQRFTDWTNLSEATFILPPTAAGAAAGADYRVRIFCPGRELAFAGHPTLGSCHAWLAAGGQPQAAHLVVQECGIGLVPIRRDGSRLAFAAPPLRRGGPLSEGEVQRIAQGFKLPRAQIVSHQWCANGPSWQAVMLASAEQVLQLQPDPVLLAGLEVGVIGPHPPGSECAYEVRGFFAGSTGHPTEDPVTGSLNAALAQWLIGAGLAPNRYIVAQGTRLGRQGRVHIDHINGTVWVGGDVAPCIEGMVSFELTG